MIHLYSSELKKIAKIADKLGMMAHFENSTDNDIKIAFANQVHEWKIEFYKPEETITLWEIRFIAPKPAKVEILDIDEDLLKQAFEKFKKNILKAYGIEEDTEV